MTEAEQEIARSHDEVQEVMKALEELALSYDSKDSVIENLESDKLNLTSEIDSLQVNRQGRTLSLSLPTHCTSVHCFFLSLSFIQSKIYAGEKSIQSLNDMLDQEKKKNKNSLVLLFKELNEMGAVLGSHSDDMIQVWEEIGMGEREGGRKGRKEKREEVQRLLYSFVCFVERFLIATPI